MNIKHKNFVGYIILNWKNGSKRLVNKAPKNLGPYEVTAKFNFEVTVPEIPVVELSGKVEIPEVKLREAFAREI